MGAREQRSRCGCERRRLVETYSGPSGDRLRVVEQVVGADLSLFLRLCREETEWIVVEARAMRAEQKERANER